MGAKLTQVPRLVELASSAAEIYAARLVADSGTCARTCGSESSGKSSNKKVCVQKKEVVEEEVKEVVKEEESDGLRSINIVMLAACMNPIAFSKLPYDD